MIKKFCDVCGQEIERNVVSNRLIVEKGEFKTEVLISKNGVTNEGDLCMVCLLNILNTKPKRKYTRKEKVVENANS